MFFFFFDLVCRDELVGRSVSVFSLFLSLCVFVLFLDIDRHSVIYKLAERIAGQRTGSKRGWAILLAATSGHWSRRQACIRGALFGDAATVDGCGQHSADHTAGDRRRRIGGHRCHRWRTSECSIEVEIYVLIKMHYFGDITVWWHFKWK